VSPWSPWTDQYGVVHIHVWGTGRTLCGEATAHRQATQPVVGCEDCVTKSIKRYAATHACGPQCHA
jgi:hypothetical protein